MGGKGKRRREKNYRAAHGGFSRLPPPPDASKADALPSKLRRLISFTSSRSQESVMGLNDAKKRSETRDGASQSRKPVDEIVLENATAVEDSNVLTSQHTNHSDDAIKNSSADEKRKKKRTREQVKDLRFAEELEKSNVSSKRREKKKKYLEARKNKKKVKTEDRIDFPGHEKIKFGDIVQAPPKLVAVPKAFKSSHSASHERIRLNAIEEYRKRRGWTSRPGIHVPSPTTVAEL